MTVRAAMCGEDRGSFPDFSGLQLLFSCANGGGDSLVGLWGYLSSRLAVWD